MYISNTNYFRSNFFDSLFIIAIPAIAIFSANIAYRFPQYFELILLLDLTFLGYHHVISTYTRIAASKLTIIENRFLVFVLPIIVLIAVTILALSGSVWLIATIYLHWQWWHYTRQSEGIEKSIKFKTKSKTIGSSKLARLLFYAIPIAAFLYMSSKQHTTFLFMPVKTISVPSMLADCLLFMTVALLLSWLLLQIDALRKKEISKSHFYYLITHHLIYLVAYVFFDDITVGWLAINIWHNAQYILFVWHFNNNKFAEGVDRRHFVLSWLSQRSTARVFMYFSLCLIATFIFYSLIDLGVLYFSSFTTLPLVVIAYQAVNFHHYVVDSVIWKIKKPSIRESIGINAKAS